jgi:hypothetical protein
MPRPVDELKAFISRMAKQARVRKPLVAFLAVILVLQLYFVRELIAAEVLFGLGFLVLAVIGGILYLVGSIGERSFNLLEAGVRAIVPYMRRGYVRTAEFSKKPFRHPRSESAQ